MDEFYPHPSGRYGRTAKCKACLRAENAERGRRRYRDDPEAGRAAARARRRANPPDPRRPEEARAWRVRKLYGLSLAEYDELVAKPCAICGATEAIVLDHDHETGQIREGLCNSCNNGIGRFRDDPERLEAAAAYLRRHTPPGKRAAS